MHSSRAFIIIAFILTLCLASCAKQPISIPEFPAVVVTTDALYEMVTHIGGERVSVIKLIPDGAELHDFEPRAKDIVALGEADLLIMNGLGLEPWIDDAARASGSGGLITVDASVGVTPIPASDHGGEYDPHIWLSLTCAGTMAANIRDALCDADPDGATYYSDNCADFTARLDAMHKEYTAILSASDNRALVTGHAVFAYLCRDFGLTQESAEGVFAEGEPSPKRMAELVDYCIENGVTTVFAESGHSSRITDTLAREAGARVVTIYTIEAAEDGLSYLERMEYNLSAIASALPPAA